MQSCDCFERCDSRKAHCDRKSPFTCKSDVKKSTSNPFSIDAILSKPCKIVDGENLMRASPSSPIGKRYGMKPCYFEAACHTRSRQVQVHSCCQKSCYHQPPHRLDYMSFFRYPRFVDEDTSEHSRRCHDEPATMIQVGKHGYPISCPGCSDCSLSIPRLHRDQRRPIYGDNDIITHDENALSLAQDMRRNKRKRTIFTAEQLDRLEHEFQQQQYVVGQERKYLAVELGLNEIQVKVWFQNRRIKWRKQKNSRMPHASMQMEEIEM